MGAPRQYQDDWLLANYYCYATGTELTNAYNAEFGDNLTRRVLSSHCEQKLQLFRNNKYYTAEQDAWLVENFSKLGRKECTRQFNEKFGQRRSEASIKVRCNKYLGLRISDENASCHRSNARTRYFSGHEIINASGYTLVKVNDERRYITKQRYLYEQVYGKIADGYSVIFLDGDRTNFNLSNLIAVPNSYIRAIMYQRYSLCIKRDENVVSEVRARINREIIKLYELEKVLYE